MKKYLSFLFILFFCVIFISGISAQLEYDLKTNEFKNYEFEPTEQTVHIKNINPLLFTINMTANSKVYSANRPIRIPEISDFETLVSPEIETTGNTLSDDQKAYNNFLSEFEIIKNEYELDPNRLDALLRNVDTYIGNLANDNMTSLTGFHTLRSDIKNFQYFTNQSFHINTDSADAVDITIEVVRKSLTDKADLDTSISVHRLYKQKYWSFSISAGFFGSKFKQKSFEWGEDSEFDGLITDIDSQSVFRIMEDEEEQFTLGINTLTHMMYSWSPNVSTGFHFGLGISYIDRVIPQFQYGLSFGFLKGKRLIINIGGNASYQKYDLDAEINRNALYGNSARNSLNLEGKIKKRFQHSLGTISISYQIL